MEMEVIPPDELFSPYKASQGFYSKALQGASKSFRADASTGGCQGDVQKVPIQSAKEVLKTREGRDWIVDQFIPRCSLNSMAVLLAPFAGFI